MLPGGTIAAPKALGTDLGFDASKRKRRAGPLARGLGLLLRAGPLALGVSIGLLLAVGLLLLLAADRVVVPKVRQTTGWGRAAMERQLLLRAGRPPAAGAGALHGGWRRLSCAASSSSSGR